MFGRADGAALARMIRAMHHRGPDDQGAYQDACAAIGMARLSILDLSPAGHQPMSSEDGGIQLVYNGELYNFREERALLEKQGARFRSHSDTEVVLKLYERYGDDFVTRMRGMFAVAVYDKRRGPGRERLVLARDHLGIKPLLYTHVRGALLFASEMKALLASGLVAREPDAEAFRLLLTHGSILQPRTAVKGVRMLMPGQRLIIDSGGAREETYWRLSTERRAELARLSYDEQVECVAQTLEESVRLQMVSDVPLGAFLSGGVDSGLVVGLMSRLTNHTVKTFSVGYAAQFAELDETADAQRQAAFIGTDHTRVVIEDDEVARHLLPLAAALDQPTVDGANSYFVSLATRRAVTVALSGTGGDEMFAGYPWFIDMLLESRADRERPLRRMAQRLIAEAVSQAALDPLISRRGGSRLEAVRQRAGFVARYASRYQIFSARQTAALLATPWGRLAAVGRAQARDIAASDELPTATPVRRVSALATRGYLLNQLLRDIDAVSMAHSLEVRVPLVDPVVADVALALPDSVKLDAAALTRAKRQTYAESGAKKILIEAAVRRGLVPKTIADQPKRGFGMPFTHWLTTTLREPFDDALSGAAVLRRGLFAPEAVAAVKRDFAAGRTGWAQPWLLMMTELWCREVLDKGPGPLSV